MLDKGNILILTYWSWEDALIQTYTLPYLHQINRVLDGDRKIFLLTQEKNDAKTEITPIQGTRIYRKEIAYTPFGARAAFRWLFLILKLSRFIRKNNIEVIHAWCTPAGGIGYLLSFLTGKKLTIDSFEPHAEAMVENGTWKRSGLAFRIMYFLERKQYKRASVLISCVEGMKDYSRQRWGNTSARFFTKPACTNLELFSPDKNIRQQVREKLELENKIVMVYAGKLGGIYFDKEVFQFAKACEDFWKDKFHFLLLTGDPEEKILEYCHSNHLSPTSVTRLFVPHHEVANYLQAADFAITPVKNVPSKKYCTPIKDGEYWALGLPVVISPDISTDSAMISKEKTGVIVDFADRESFPDKIMELAALIEDPSIRERARAIALKERNFRIAETIYETLYSSSHQR